MKGAFAANPMCLRDLESGDFEIKGPDGSVIIPQVWESLAAPGWLISISFHGPVPLKGRRRAFTDSSSSLSSSTISDELEEESDTEQDRTDDHEIVYDHDVVYTVQTYRKLLLIQSRHPGLATSAIYTFMLSFRTRHHGSTPDTSSSHPTSAVIVIENHESRRLILMRTAENLPP
jgi:hypothetical protein